MMRLARILAAAAALVIMVSAAPATAQTTCDAANRFTLNWDAQTPKDTNLGTGARNFVVTNAQGASVTVTMSFAGDVTHYVNSGFGQTPNLSVQNVGGITAGEYTLFLATTFAGYASDIGTTTNTAIVRFGFSTPVREVSFRILDVDFSAGQFRDWIRVSGSNGPTYVPAVTTPYGRSNTSNPGVTAPGVAFLGAGTSNGFAFPSGDASGVGISSTTQDFGNIAVAFAQPITQAEVRYANGPTSTMTGTAGVQSVSIHDISFCPLPAISVAKTSAPATAVITDPNRFNIPGADVDYTITVTNSGGSTVDLSTANIADTLPANVTFFNGDIDAGTAGTQNFLFNAGTSGLSLTAGNITYLNAANGVITPAAGYDPLVRTVRFAPTGTMAANSSFTVTFRSRIN